MDTQKSKKKVKKKNLKEFDRRSEMGQLKSIERLDLKKKVRSAQRTVHRKSVKHTQKHLTPKGNPLKRIAARRLLASSGIKLAFIILLLVISFWGIFKAERFPSFKNGGDLVFGVRDPKENLNLNPLTLSSPTELAVGSLIYSSLLSYDSSGKLIGDLAESYVIEDGGKLIKLKLRDGAAWHDGKEVTVEDVIFTFNSLKDSRVESNLRNSVGSVEINATGEHSFEIKTPKAIGALDDLLVKVKIAPKHLFDSLPVEEYGRLDYNQLPVGSGPLEVGGEIKSRDSQTLGLTGSGKIQQIPLVTNPKYYGNSAQSNLVIRKFADAELLNEALEKNVVTMYIDSGNGNSLSASYAERDLKFNSGVFSFFNNQDPILSDQKIRVALSKVIDKSKISELADGARPLNSPVLGIGDEATEPDENTAKKLIMEAGWQLNSEDGFYYKDGTKLSLSLVTGISKTYKNVAEELQSTWKRIGVDVEVTQAADRELQASYLVAKNYGILLYGISMGNATEPYTYWSSSAASSTGLNFSNYKSVLSDVDLDIARTKVDSGERRTRLERFVKRWKEDQPAVALYSPSAKVVYKKNMLETGIDNNRYYNSYGEAFSFLRSVKTKKAELYRTEDL